MSRWLRLFPKAWRARYGAEVTEALSASHRSTVADVVDLLVAAAAAWGDHFTDRLDGRRALMRLLRVASLVLVGLGVASVAWATAELRSGITELPRHWWSTLAAAPLAAGAVLAWMAWRPSGMRRPT